MRSTARRLTSLAVALGLAAGGLTVAAGGANAAPFETPLRVVGEGQHHGYSISWERPDDDTGLTGYSASIYLATGGTLVQGPVPVDLDGPADNGDLYATFTGLTPGVKYQGTVAAVYGSTLSGEIFGGAQYALQPVGRIASPKAKAGNKTLSLSWRAPSTNVATGPVDYYEVVLNGYSTYTPATQRSLLLIGLTNGRRYVVQVYAYNARTRGNGTNVGATPIGAPTKPSKFKRSWLKGGKAKLTWKRARSTAAAPVSGYYVYVNGKRKATLGSGSTSYTAKGLKKGKRYSFSIKARNAVGTSSTVTIASKKRP